MDECRELCFFKMFRFIDLFLGFLYKFFLVLELDKGMMG